MKEETKNKVEEKWTRNRRSSLPEAANGEEMEEPSQKLFRLPGTIEEEEEEEQAEDRAPKEVVENTVQTESPLLGQKVIAGTFSGLPRNVTLVRVSTQSSSIAGGVYRQDSSR